MKNTIKTLALALFFIACGTTKSQTAKKMDGKFENKLEDILTSINDVQNVEGLFENINKLKRLSSMYPDEWLADYYVALMDIKLSIGSENEERQKSLLKEAKEILANLKEKDNAPESEVLTLDGYYYYALIAQDPQMNGQQHYMDVIGAYQKAIALDNTNPRPVIMLTIFKKMMAKYTGSDASNLCQDFSKAEQILTNSKPKSKVYPSWGNTELKRHQQESCS